MVKRELCQETLGSVKIWTGRVIETQRVSENFIQGMRPCKIMKCTLSAWDSWVKYSQAEGDQEQRHGEGTATHLQRSW